MANNRRKSDLPAASMNQQQGRLDESSDLPEGRLDQRQGDLEPRGVNPRVQGGPEARGGMAGPGIAGSGTHGLQDDVNRGGPIGQSGKPAPTVGMNKAPESKK